MTAQPQVQIYIPVFNQIAFLPDAAESALGQKGVALEVIISDNASSDGTFEYAREMASKHANVRVYRNETNIGPLANYNNFKRHVSAPFYMLLCSDDFILDDSAIGQAYGLMQQRRDVASVYCDMLYVDAKGRALVNRSFGREGLFDAAATLKQSIIRRRNLFGVPLLHRAAVATKVTPPDRYDYAYDIYHSAKVAEGGLVYHLPKPLIANRYTGKNLSVSLLDHGNSQFGYLEEEFGVNLNSWERLKARCNEPLVTLSKQAFYAWARYRSA